jgi:hypothetical protein
MMVALEKKGKKDHLRVVIAAEKYKALDKALGGKIYHAERLEVCSKPQLEFSFICDDAAAVK